MQRKTLHIAALLAVFATSSCTEKQYTCQCMGGVNAGGVETVVTATNRVSAKNMCNQYSNPAGTPNGQSCNLKD